MSALLPGWLSRSIESAQARCAATEPDHGGDPIVGALYACTRCGARFLSANGRLVAGSCPAGRSPCPLEPVTAGGTAAAEPMLAAPPSGGSRQLDS